MYFCLMPDFYKILLKNNREWVAAKLKEDPEFFTKLAHGQSPPLLWIGCADSRVPANEIIGARPGEVFVHRNIANMVVHSDMNMLSVLNYAVRVLEVKHVIVCGHYGCGGVVAAMTNQHYGLIDNWLRHIKDVYRLHNKELDAIADEKTRQRRFVELNVIEQVYNLCKTSSVQEAWEEKRSLQVHGWVYDVANGIIKDLEVTACDDKDIPHYYRYDF
ncbi:MAG: carbonic anhydrase [Bacteroidetes bacterium]|nr:MAG: carbonic anhydrase [Bacteroidota bacterium]